VTARRALTPAARGVSLAVLAALRGGRVDLADQADGSTLATSTAPDGTELLRAVLHMPVRGHDPRQLTLPAVAPVPVPAEVPPAPEDTETTRINGLAVGDQITLDGELVEVMGLDDDGWTWRTVGDDPRTRDEGECLWSEVEHVEGTRWRVLPVRTDETPAQQREAARPKRAAKAPKAVPARNVPVPEADDLAIYGERSIVAIIHEGGPWELVWSDALPGHMSYEVAVSATAAQAHRVRVYHRGKRCVRDSRDRGAK
jgi:hypothetical protein